MRETWRAAVHRRAHSAGWSLLRFGLGVLQIGGAVLALQQSLERPTASVLVAAATLGVSMLSFFLFGQRRGGAPAGALPGSAQRNGRGAS